MFCELTCRNGDGLEAGLRGWTGGRKSGKPLRVSCVSAGMEGREGSEDAFRTLVGVVSGFPGREKLSRWSVRRRDGLRKEGRRRWRSEW